jgi:hypothetical protein
LARLRRGDHGGVRPFIGVKFLAVLTFYEAVFLLLYVGGVIPVPPFSM